MWAWQPGSSSTGDITIFVSFFSAQEKPLPFKDLVGSFVYILDQVISRKLPNEFDYHGVPAPWIQMKLLRILAILGADDTK